MDTRHDLPMFVLDVLRHDVIEQLPSIIKMLNNDGCIGWRFCWTHDFTTEEVIPVLRGLIAGGFVELVCEEEFGNQVIPVAIENVNLDEASDRLWFGLTQKGLEQWSTWNPPVDE